MPTPQTLHLSLVPACFIQLLSLQEDECAVPLLQVPAQHGSIPSSPVERAVDLPFCSSGPMHLLCEVFRALRILFDTLSPCVTALRLLQGDPSHLWLFHIVEIPYSYLWIASGWCFGPTAWSSGSHGDKDRCWGQWGCPGEGRGSGWAIQVGTAGQSRAGCPMWDVTAGWWTPPGQAHILRMGSLDIPISAFVVSSSKGYSA